MRYRYLFVHVFAFLMIVSSASPAQKKKWTVMLYASGEDDGLTRQTQCTLTQLLQITPSKDVAVVSEMQLTIAGLGKDDINRLSKNFCDADGHKKIPLWNGTWRFRLDANAAHGLKPIEFRQQADMNNSPELMDFLQWAKTESPADKYILIIKKHGPDMPSRAWGDAFDKPAPDVYGADDRFKVFTLGLSSRDRAEYETDEILNNKTTFAVEFSFPERLSVLALDSCSRAFLENAFELQKFVDILVASEDDVTLPARWHYEDWIPRLVDHPEMSANELGDLILRRYENRYAHDDAATDATLSVANLPMLGLLVSRFDDLLDLFGAVSVEPQLLQLRPAPYALSNVDFMSFMNNLGQRSVVTTTATQAQAQAQFQSSYAALASTFSSAIEAFAGPTAKSAHGSLGMTLYFPDCCDYDMRTFMAGPYNPDNYDALPMVRAHPKWACVLKTLLAQQCNQPCLDLFGPF